MYGVKASNNLFYYYYCYRIIIKGIKRGKRELRVILEKLIIREKREEAEGRGKPKA